MISLADKDNFSTVSAKDDPMFCRIYGDFVCADKLNFRTENMFWTDGKSLFMEKTGDSLILSGKVTDADEILSFIDFISPRTVMVSENLHDTLALDYKDCGYIMTAMFKQNDEPHLPDADFRMKDYYSLFQVCGLESDYSGFCSSMAEYIKTDTGFFCGKYIDGILAAGAAVTGVTDDSAVITALAVSENYRRQRLGTDLISEISKTLPGRKLIVFRENDRNEEFYKSLGFENCGLWFIAAMR